MWCIRPAVAFKYISLILVLTGQAEAEAVAVAKAAELMALSNQKRPRDKVAGCVNEVLQKT